MHQCDASLVLAEPYVYCMRLQTIRWKRHVTASSNWSLQSMQVTVIAIVQCCLLWTRLDFACALTADACVTKQDPFLDHGHHQMHSCVKQDMCCCLWPGLCVLAGQGIKQQVHSWSSHTLKTSQAVSIHKSQGRWRLWQRNITFIGVTISISMISLISNFSCRIVMHNLHCCTLHSA